ncbi:MAG: biopolymer transporter ExbD [Planctomycetales bacterium]|nr:biopolymer transporter ExbD [Planctomycetales bacterium]
MAKRSHLKDVQEDANMDMTPMIDVVFLLIIFFLVSSHLAQRESRIELDLPVATKGQDDVPNDSKRIIVNVLPSGSILIGGREVLPESLAQLFTTKAGSNPEDVQIRIRGDRNVTYDKVSPIMKSAVDAGIWNVIFTVVEQ